MKDSTQNSLINKRIALFIGFEILLVALLSVALFKINPLERSVEITVIYTIFMFLPLLAMIITRILTKDKSQWLIKPKFKGNSKTYLMACYIPGILILVGAFVYFLSFPSHLDLTLSYVKEAASQSGQEVKIPKISSIWVVLGIYVVVVIFSPLVIINHIFAYGEESGWRGYLLPLLIKKFGVVGAVLSSGALWGLAHAPLVLYGLNYSGDYFGKPFAGILMMVVFATFVGIFLSYLTLKSQSIIPASIAHGVINALSASAVVICDVSKLNPLFGPSPAGILGMTGFIVIGIVLLIQLKKQFGFER